MQLALLAPGALLPDCPAAVFFGKIVEGSLDEGHPVLVSANALRPVRVVEHLEDDDRRVVF